MLEEMTLEELAGWRQSYLHEIFLIEEEIKIRLAGVKIAGGENISADIMTLSERTPTPPTLEE
jgi:hypothetical protein